MSEREEVEESLLASWLAGAYGDVATRLLRAYGSEILRFLISTMRDRASADDAFSAFCENMLRGLPSFQRRSSFRTWAYAIARNEARQQMLLRGRRARREARIPSEGLLSELAEKVRTETAAHLRTEVKTKISKLRDELPAEERELLVLRIDRGLEWQEIAQIVFEPSEGPVPDPAEVKRRAARLRKRFQGVKEKLLERGRREGLIGGEELG